MADDPARFETLINEALHQLRNVRPEPRQFTQRGGRKRSLDTALLSQAARRLRLDQLELSEETRIMSNQQHRVGFFQNMPWTLTALDRFASHDKALTKRILSANGVPVPRGAVVTDLDGAVQYFREIGPPVVVKPVTGSGGHGITVDVQDEATLTVAVETALARRRRIVVEECLTSIDLRVMVVHGRAVAAMLRVPANVTGDGLSTVAELVEQKNRLRQANPYLRHVPIKISAATAERLARHSLGLDSVLPIGQRFYFHYKANLSSGGDSYGITELVHPDILRLAERAAGCFASVRHAGVDVLLERFDAPLSSQRGVVCEINCNNDMPIHEFPLFGKPLGVAQLELRSYLGTGPRLPRLRRRLKALLGRPSQGARPGGRAGPPAAPAASDWPTLWEMLDKPAVCTTPHQDAGSTRELDTRALAAALSDRGWHGVRDDGRLLYARTDGVDLILERNRTSTFATAVAKRREVLHGLLTSAGIATCRATRFQPQQLDDALQLFRAAPGPWNLRAIVARRPESVRYSIRGEETFRRAWSRLSKGARSLVLEQAAVDVTLRCLLVGDTFLSSIAAVRASVVGDGHSTVNELVARRAEARSTHPALRHLGTEQARTIHRGHGLPETQVPRAGQRVVAGRSPYLAAGADTIGFIECPVPDLPDLAYRVRELIGGPPILAVTFAARPASTDISYRHWSVTGIAPDPSLALFAWPWAGEAKAGDVYSAVAAELQSGHHYRLPASA